MRWSGTMRAAGPKWLLVFRTKGGHKLFRDEKTGEIAVADQSGYYPEQTEDGVLWLDRARPVVVGIETADVPLIRDASREKSWTITGAVSAMEAAALLGLKVEFTEAAKAFLQAAKKLPEPEKTTT